MALLEARENIDERVGDYLPSESFLREYGNIDSVGVFYRQVFRNRLPGGDFVLGYSHLDHKLVIVPPWHRLVSTPNFTHAGDYGSGMFEGHSVEPVVRNGVIVGSNLVLHGPRVERAERSIDARLFVLPIGIVELHQGILDLVAILGDGILLDRKGKPSRGYVRPTARPGAGTYKIGVTPEHLIDVGVIAWNWPFYFLEPERVYKGSGLVVLANGEQRLSKIWGKHASNYGEAGSVGTQARNHGADEALYFGPYLVDEKTGSTQLVLARGLTCGKMLQMVVADGPGEEVFAITSDGELWYPPMDVNRLGGTTLAYIVNYMCPKLRIRTKERPFNLRQVAEGEIVGLAYTGNAARVAPIGDIRVKGSDGETNLQIEVPQTLKDLQGQYESEVTGQIEPSARHLLTPINLQAGKQARLVLEQAFAGWL